MNQMHDVLHGMAIKQHADLAAVASLISFDRVIVNALDKVEDGERAWISDARCESYHTVWIEMYEDLLRILARQHDD